MCSNQLKGLLLIALIFASPLWSSAQTCTSEPFHPDFNVLKEFYEAADGGSWNRNQNWLTCDVCTWEGITCEGGRVSRIELEDNNIDGRFIILQDDLVDLKRLDISGNNIQLGFVSDSPEPLSINYLDVSDNAMGYIPARIEDMPLLSHLDLSGNNIEEEMAGQFLSLPPVSYLNLSDNRFYGNIPVYFANKSSLDFLDLSDNALIGCVPASYTNLCGISDMVFLDNNCNRGIPLFSDWCNGSPCSEDLILSAPPEVCIGGTAEIEILGGYDNYSWDFQCDEDNNNRLADDVVKYTALCPGTYSVTVTTLKGCELSASVSIDGFQEPNQFTDVQFCEFEDVVVQGTPYDSPGTYFVPQETTEGCTYDLVVAVSEVPRPRRSIYLETCEGTSVSAYGREFTTSGIFEEEVTSPSFCDSIITIYVDVLPTFTSNVNLSVCPGSQAAHDGQFYPVGDDQRVYQAVNGCDSVVLINVVELPEYSTDLSLQACTGTTVSHDGEDYMIGDHERTYEAQNGCDSILNISVEEVFASNESESYEICNGQTVEVNGYEYSGGNYQQDFVNSDGCASILTVDVTEIPPYEVAEQLLMCDNEPVIYAGDTYTSGGTYEVPQVDEQGCNFIVNLEIKEAERSRTDIYLPKCDQENTVIYQGQAFSNSGGFIYETNAAGCDSVVRVWLVREYSTEETITPEPVCRPDRVAVNGIEYSSTGTYTQNLLNVAGCDSTLYINVTVNRRKTEYLFLDICPGGTVTVNGTTYDEAGFESQNLLTVAGCDSLLEIVIDETDLIVEENTVVLCGDEEYTENGSTYVEAGMDEDYFTTSQGCDSLYRLFIEKYENTSQTIFDRLCTGDDVMYNGETISAGGTYVQDLINANGCDSTLTIEVSEFSPSEAFVQRETCDGEHWTENGEALYEDGLHTQTLTNSVGCDSVLTIDLRVKQHTSETLPVQLCVGENITINGVYYDATEIDVQNLTNAEDCDSTLRIEVTVVDAVRADHVLEMCEGSSINYNDEVFSETEVREQYFISAAGCDSILTVYSYVYEHTFGEVETTLCTGSTVDVNGWEYSTGGTKMHVIENARGCDSTITVFIEELSPSSSQNTFYMCEGDTEYINGEAYEYGGEFEQRYTNAVGCDSTFYIELIEYPDTESRELHLICPGERVEVNFEEYLLPDIYEQHFINARGCDSTLFIEVKYNEPSDTTVYDFICDEGSYEFMGETLSSPGEYPFETLTVRGCDSLITLSLGYLTGNDTTIYRSICEGDFFQFGSNKIYAGGSYFDEIIIGGCKAPTTLELEVLEPSIGFRERHICEGGKIWIDDGWVTEAGLYQEPLESKAGCDSILYTEVFLEEHQETTIDTFICEGGSLFVANRWFYEPGYYKIFRETQYFCDSTIKVNIDLYDSIPDVFEFEVCEGEMIDFEGSSFGVGEWKGTYFDGTCEQRYILKVSQTEQKVINETLIICDQAVDFLGETYNHSGQYLIEKDVGDCTFVEYLNVIDNNVSSSFEKLFLCHGSSINLEGQVVTESGHYLIENCANSRNIELNFISSDTLELHEVLYPGEGIVIEGQLYNEVGEYEVLVGEEGGCSAILMLTIEIQACGGIRNVLAQVCEGDTFDFFGTKLGDSGEYTYNKNLGNPGCDSTILLDLVVMSIDEFEIIGDQVICQGDTTLLTGPTGVSYLWNTGENTKSIIVDQGGVYTLEVQNEIGCSQDATFEVDMFTFPASLDIEIKSPVSCEEGDGQISVILSNEDAYRYSSDGGTTWQESSTFSGLYAGDYQILLGDPSLSCFRADAIPVTLVNKGIPSIIGLSSSPANSCVGLLGSISVEVTNSAGLEFSIDGGLSWQSEPYFDGLDASTYQVYISPEESSCINDFIDPIEVLDVSSLEAEISIIQGLTCDDAEDAAVLIGITQGQPPFEISWDVQDDQFSMSTSDYEFEVGDLSTGTYNFTIKDWNECVIELDRIVESVDLDASLEVFTDTTLCDGDTLHYVVEDSFLNYLVFKDDLFYAEGSELAISDFGDYQVIVENGADCNAGSYFTVAEVDVPGLGIDFLMSTEGIVDVEVIAVNVTDGPNVNQVWVIDSTIAHVTSIDAFTRGITFMDTGTYAISLHTLVDGCLFIHEKEIIIYPDSTHLGSYEVPEDPLDIARFLDWTVSPNPNAGEFLVKVNVSSPFHPVTLRVYDFSGSQVASRRLVGMKSYSHTFNLSTSGTGIYTVVLDYVVGQQSKQLLIIK